LDRLLTMTEPPRDPPPRPNSSHLRDAIDSGATGGKVAAPDPAAAPLGTDAEAGGHPPTEAEVARSLDQEVRHPRATQPPGLNDAMPGVRESPVDTRILMIAAAVFCVIVVAILLVV
jgi:hypothetical protein